MLFRLKAGLIRLDADCHERVQKTGRAGGRGVAVANCETNQGYRLKCRVLLIEGDSLALVTPPGAPNNRLRVRRSRQARKKSQLKMLRGIKTKFNQVLNIHKAHRLSVSV